MSHNELRLSQNPLPGKILDEMLNAQHEPWWPDRGRSTRPECKTNLTHFALTTKIIFSSYVPQIFNLTNDISANTSNLDDGYASLCSMAFSRPGSVDFEFMS